MDEFIKVALNNGLFAALFCFLLFYVLKETGAREKRYQETIKGLSDHLQVVNEIKDDLVSLKDKVVTAVVTAAKNGLKTVGQQITTNVLNKATSKKENTEEKTKEGEGN